MTAYTALWQEQEVERPSLQTQARSRETKLEMALGFKCSTLVSEEAFPPAGPYLLNVPRQCSQLETKYRNIRAFVCQFSLTQ